MHLGFPYTRYAFNPELRGEEVYIGDVPVFVPLSYTFMAYFAFAAGRCWLRGRAAPARRARGWSGCSRGCWRCGRCGSSIRSAGSASTSTWAAVFAYAGPGFWFGLPTGSQVGFAATAAVLLAALFWMTRDEPDFAVDRALRHPHLAALLTYHGQVFHLVVVGFWIGRDVPAANTIAGAGLLMWVPIAAMTAVYWSSLGGRD